MRKILCFLLCVVLLLAIPVTVGADSEDFSIGQTWDNAILAGGIYDMKAWVGDDADDYIYRWQVDVSMGDGSWMDLEDNADPYGYSGTDTFHLQFITPRTGSFVIGTGWEDIPFRCVITNKKTGVTKTTASMFMDIFTSDDLPEYLKKQGFGLYEPTVKGATGLQTGDYINYTASAFAGKQMDILCGCWRPGSEHLLRQSNFTENVEIWITENGKTVKTDGSAVYTPYTIGKNAVTVEFKLHHTLGIHDLGYYETKTVKLTTQEPTPVDYGTAKYQISLLKERYNESQKLVSIPKGTELKITEKGSGWCQVSYGGYVGYVSASAVTLQNRNPTIDHVDIEIAEPVAGKLPATTCSITPDTCVVTSIEWLDKTNDRFMQPEECFQKGHTYQLIIWATAKEGFSFRLDADEKMRTTALINTNCPAFTSRAYERIIGKVIDIRFDFVNVKEATESHTCSLKLVPRVEPTCTQSGFEAYYKCSCGKTYSDAQGKNAINTGTWGKIAPLGHLETVYQSDPYMHYKSCGRLACGEDLSQYRGYHSGGSATCQQYAVCDVCGKEYGQKADHKWSKEYLYREEGGHAHTCENASCTAHDELSPHVPGPEATETQPQKCKICQYILVPAGNHTHKLTLVEAVDATCLTAGNQAYYTCDGCEDWFWDKEGKNPVTDRKDVQLLPLDHFAEQWQYDEENHWQNCIVCMTQIAKQPHLDEDDNGECDICNGKTGDRTPSTDPEVTEKDKMDRQDQTEEPGKHAAWLPWALMFLAIFIATVTITVMLLKKKNKS